MPTRDEIVKYLRDLTVEEARSVLSDIESAWLSRIILHQPCQGCLKVVFGPHACPGPDRSGVLLAAAYGMAPQVEWPTQYEFDVVLKSFSPENKVQVIKKLRELFSFESLADAVKLATTLPATVSTGNSRDYANSVAAKLRTVGAVVEVR